MVQPISEPTVAAAAWRYRGLVAAFVGAGLVLGVAAGLLGTSEFEASAEIVVEDPRAAAVFERVPSSDSARYVETQASIMRSEAVAARAAGLGRDSDRPVDLSLTDLLDGLEVSTSDDSALIKLTFAHPDANVALAAPSLVAAAYEDERRAAAFRGSQAAIDELSESIAEGAAELDALEAGIAAARGATDARLALEEQFEEIIRLLVVLQDPTAVPGDGSVLAFPSIATQRETIQVQLEAILLVLQIENERPELTSLTQRQQAAIDRLTALESRRDQLVIDAELAGGGVVLFSPARRAVQAGSGLVRWAGLGIIVGLMFGTGAAYYLALRRRRITVRTEPEVLLGAPLLAEVPDFGGDRKHSPLPVADAPGSGAAEAFRFAAAAVDLPDRSGAGEGRPAALLAIASASVGDGKSTVAANLAVAVARQGHRVLALDADFGDLALSQLLLPFESPTTGMVDCVLGGVEVAEAVYTIESSQRHSLELLPRGLGHTTAPEFFHRTDVTDFLAQMARRYDLIVIDTPPLLQVAYATTLVGLAQSVIIVVGHDTGAARLEAVRDRLDLIGTPVRGYVYNRAPADQNLEEGMGSLRDRLGRSVGASRDG